MCLRNMFHGKAAARSGRDRSWYLDILFPADVGGSTPLPYLAHPLDDRVYAVANGSGGGITLAQEEDGRLAWKYRGKDKVWGIYPIEGGDTLRGDGSESQAGGQPQGLTVVDREGREKGSYAGYVLVPWRPGAGDRLYFGTRRTPPMSYGL